MINRFSESGDELLLPDDGSCPCCNGWSDEISFICHRDDEVADHTLSVSGFPADAVIVIRGEEHVVQVQVDALGEGLIHLPGDAAADLMRGMMGI